MAKKSRCTLRISSRSMDVADIVRTVGMQPTKAYEQGDPISVTTKRPRDQALVLFEGNVPPEADLQEHVAAMVEVLKPRHANLSRLAGECSIDLFCMFASGSGQGSLEFSPALLKNLADLGLPIIIDLYPPAGE
jgi:hypothetical protein